MNLSELSISPTGTSIRNKDDDIIASFSRKVECIAIFDAVSNCAKARAQLATLQALLVDHLHTLESVGFGTDDDINGGDAVDAVNEHFEKLQELVGAV